MQTAHKVAIYLYRRKDPVAGTDAQWGTLDAIAKLDGCDPITRSARRVDPALLDPEGFLPYGLSPDDVA
jgi:hypothetical protein